MLIVLEVVQDAKCLPAASLRLVLLNEQHIHRNGFARTLRGAPGSVAVVGQHQSDGAVEVGMGSDPRGADFLTETEVGVETDAGQKDGKE